MAQGVRLDLKRVGNVSTISFKGTPWTEYKLYGTENLGLWEPGDSVIIRGNETGDYSFTHNIDEDIVFYKITSLGPTPALSLKTIPSGGVVLGKGQEGEVLHCTMQSGPSDIRLNKVSLDFDKRLWLYVDTITILDGTTVIAHKENLNASDFTELSVGSSYRLSLPVDDLIPRASERGIVVRLGMRPVSDQVSTTISITQIQTRATDSGGISETSMDTNAQLVEYTAVSNGQVIITLDENSPPPRVVKISQAAQTDNVLLAMFDIRSQNVAGILRQVVLRLHVENTSVPALFSDVKIKVNGNTYSADAIMSTSDNSGYATFSNLGALLLASQTVTMSVYGQINQDVNGTLTGDKAYVSLVTSTSSALANNPEVEDSNFQPIDVVSTIVQGSTVTFSSAQAVLSNLSAKVDDALIATNTIVAQSFQFAFTVTAGDNTLYMSKHIGVALTTTTTGYIGEAPAGFLIRAELPDVVAGDSVDSHVVPAGSSRTFIYYGLMGNQPSSGVVPRTFSITAIHYGTSSADPAAHTINYGLEDLRVSTVL